MQALLEALRDVLRQEYRLFGPVAFWGASGYSRFSLRTMTTAAASPAPYDRIAALIPPDSPLHHLSTLEAVRQYVAQTVLVPIDAHRLHAVFGTGNPNAELMVIGEAPGAEEDRQGEPFVGPAGQLLTKMLGSIGFKREEVYITNVVKSRPPQNRDPLPAEIEAHLPILYKQMVLVKPRLLLCVGRIAGGALLGREQSLRSLRGKVHDFYGLPVVVTYHPAALLRHPPWKRLAWEDLQLLRACYDALQNPKQS
ncbi:hypothetical protein HRbin18_02253 [bacterium HR18]|nr:hypothetical protein HRbin18_02253 [bacterium HR18]